MSDQNCKLIEDHIKDLLFNKNASAAPQPLPATSSTNLNFNMNPYFSEKPFLSNIENPNHKENLMSLPLDCSLNKQPNCSQLIDLNVLTNFAAKHADINNDLASTAPGFLPHPELENDLHLNPGTSIRKDILFNHSIIQENKSPSKLPCFSEKMPSKNFKHSLPEKNELSNSEEINSNDQASDKRKKGKRTRKPVSKEKGNKNPVGKVAEKSVNPSLPPSARESPKRESSSSNKHSSSAKEAPVTPEKKAKTLPQEIETEKRSGIPLPLEETEYTLSSTKDFYKFMCNICNYESRSKDYIMKHLNSDGHKELKKQIEADRVLPFLPAPLPSQVEVLTDLVTQIHKEYGLREEDLTMRENVASKLKAFVECNLPGCSLEMIGSSVTGLGLRKSKVDMTLKVPQAQDIPDCLEFLYKALVADPAYSNVESDFKKKKLGILFTDMETGINCSIVLENGVTDKYARLFSFYSQLDPRVKILASCFRYWAELCSLDNQDRGTLPSITYPIMLVHFLQQIEPPVLPVLHELKEYGNVDFAEKYVKEGAWKSENNCSVGDLWIKLFYFYNFTYELGKHVICIRSSDRVLCSERNWSTKFYAVEEPFTRRNIAHVIPNFSVCHFIQQCFLRTYRYFAFPQLASGAVKLAMDEEFEKFLLTYASDKSEERDETSDESVASDNDDSSIPDDSNLLDDLEDHDPDIPIESVVQTLQQMLIDDGKDNMEEDINEDSEELAKPFTSQQDSQSTDSPKKEAKKNKAKIEEKILVRGSCSWDLGNLEISEISYKYCFDPVIFRGKKDIPFSCKLCKSSGHLKKNCPTEDRIPRPTLPEMTSEFLRVINKTLFYIRDKNCVDDADKIFMQKNMQDIESHIRKEFPEANLSMFGSFCNGFGFKSRSDMDFCLTFTGRSDSKDLDSTEVIKSLAKNLQQFPKLENIVPVTSAKVPIVKFACKESRMEGDISLYNTLAIANTEMLELYSKIDSRVQILGFALKYFAKMLGICDASRGSLSSYAYILMVIFYLQQRQPAVIPVLQELHDEEKPTHMVDGWNVWYFKDMDKLHEIWPDYGKNTETAAQLWLGLLSFYAYDFDWREYVVCIRQKALLTRFRKMWITDQIAIEDPFDLNHNLGAGLSRKMNMYILRTFARGWERFGTSLPMDKILGLQGHEVVYLFDRRFLNSGAEPPHDRGCRICGKIGHIAKNCTQEKTCLFCRKTGHLAKNCPRKKQQKVKDNKSRPDRNIHENFPYENKSNLEPQSLMGLSLRPHSGDMQRTNNTLLNHLPKTNEESRKLIQMGYPAHRHPPPGFAKNFVKGPPPGFKQMHNNNNTNKFNRFAAPFPRSKPVADLSQSPPKHYSCSPPKNFPGGNFFHPDHPPPMGIRSGLLPDPRMPPPDPLMRMWHNSMPNRMAPPPYMDRRKRTN